MPDEPQVTPLATLVWQETFETNTVGSAFPGGSSNATIDTTRAHDGVKSVIFGGDPCWGLKPLAAAAITVFRGYVMFSGALPSVGGEVLTNNGGPRFGRDQTTGRFGFLNGTGVTMDRLSNVTPVQDRWYLIEFRLNQSANPWVIDWQIDGVAQTQITYAVAAGSTSGIYLGRTVSQGPSVYLNWDSVAASRTSADYPLGPYVSAPAYNFTVSGGIQLGGTRTTTRSMARAASGGVVLGGSASSSRAKAYVRSGGVVLGGSVLTKFLGPTNLTPPVVTGSLIQGQVLTCTPGTWQQSS